MKRRIWPNRGFVCVSWAYVGRSTRPRMTKAQFDEEEEIDEGEVSGGEEEAELVR
jgi:hypothetical protein